jgi:O-antigen/teichoic acid export membrane protein
MVSNTAEAKIPANRKGSVKIFRNFGALASGRVIGDSFTFLFFVVVSRMFGQDGVGQYSFAIGLTGFFAVFADFGLRNLSIKNLSRLEGSLRFEHGRFLSLRLIMTAGSYGALLALIPFLPFPHETKLILIILGGYQIAQRLLEGLSGFFLAQEEAHLASLVEVAMKVSGAVGGIAIIFAGGGLVVCHS